MLDVGSFELALWWFFLSYLLGILASSTITRGSSAVFYKALYRPEWAAPSWLFGPVWGVLYGVNAYAAFRVRAATPGWSSTNTPALVLWLLVQIPLTLWTWLFFGRRLLLIGFLDVAAALVIAIAADVAFWTVDIVAGILLIPLVLWLAYATALALFIWFLNRTRDIGNLPPISPTQNVIILDSNSTPPTICTQEEANNNNDINKEYLPQKQLQRPASSSSIKTQKKKPHPHGRGSGAIQLL